LLTACANAESWMNVTTESTGSPYFSLGRPGVYKDTSGLELAGRVCRLARSTLLSPPRVRLEHLGAATADVIEHTETHVAAIYRGADQACSDYATHVTWTLGNGDTVRACFDGGRACPRDPDAKAVVAVPAPSTPVQ
jgi:hypothetical protein